ncbi:TraR/DksA C4-type zinc finger protein [Paenibacillus chungangensis]|uniref:TraR/DksA C4-type zinc finger protein n=1 Tax=Paenibacillus chungangensis TaxID=696535 RepID=A0ABW3HS01_9BACL
MNDLSPNQLDLLRSRLKDEYEAIQSNIMKSEHDGLARSLRDETGELSPIDNHPGDLGTELYERGKDIALLEQQELHMQRIEAALRAIEDGSYGQCASCGEPIPFERLNALPDCLYCIQHAPRSLLSDKRPVEEQFLHPPFGRTSMDEHEYSGFDGEDSWQIVENWGNSDSPAMSENRDAPDYNHIAIDAEENDGYVEAMESFLATDITGRHVTVIRNREYDDYIHSDEGDHGLDAEA